MNDFLRKLRNRVRPKHQCFGEGELCHVVDKDYEYRESQHMWTNCVQESV